MQFILKAIVPTFPGLDYSVKKNFTMPLPVKNILRFAKFFE